MSTLAVPLAVPSAAPLAATLLAITNLSISFRSRDGLLAAVRRVDLAVRPGETVAIVGESGSGKSQTALAILGLSPPNAALEGSIRFEGEELVGASTRTLNAVRGAKIGMIFQEPMTSLDPLTRVGDQIAASLRHHQKLSKAQAQARAIELLDLVRIKQPADRVRSYAHELSGGQRQRVMIALALANNPRLLIADEPTTALDVTIEAEILDLLRELKARLGMAVVFITHDLKLVEEFADHVCVMEKGLVVETAPTAELFASPKHPYTRALISAEPSGEKSPLAPGTPIVLEAKGIEVRYPGRRGAWYGRAAETYAVRGVDLTLKTGGTLGLVGESGSGKSTLGRAILRLVPASGLIRLDDRALETLSRNDMRPIRRNLQVVFQDPYGALSPRLTVGEIVTEGLLVHAPELSRTDRDARAISALTEVGLDPATRNRYPHEFSGGQRQRIAIARAMILSPKVVVLDEPTSALDRTVQRQIIDLLRRLQAERGLSYLFISHDLAVVRAMADEILVMKDGAIVERGPTRDVIERPTHPYTIALMRSAFGARASAPAT